MRAAMAGARVVEAAGRPDRVPEARTVGRWRAIERVMPLDYLGATTTLRVPSGGALGPPA
jgi:hypothetical protein